MVYKVDGNRQLDSRDWSMYSNILNLVRRWLFTSIIPYTNVNVGLKLLIIGTNVTTVFCVQRKI